MQNFYFYINMLQKRMAQKNATEKTRKKSNIFNSTQYKNYYSWLRESLNLSEVISILPDPYASSSCCESSELKGIHVSLESIILQ